MDQKRFNMVAAVIFAAVALLHALRLLMGWPVVIGGWMVPMWVSGAGLVIAAGLSYFAMSLVRRR